MKKITTAKSKLNLPKRDANGYNKRANTEIYHRKTKASLNGKKPARIILFVPFVCKDSQRTACCILRNVRISIKNSKTLPLRYKNRLSLKRIDSENKTTKKTE